MIDKLVQKVARRVVKNRWNYNPAEFEKASSLGFFNVLSVRAGRYWLKAEAVCSRHCSALHTQGTALYFNPLGMLVTHKCPPAVCPHAVAAISPIVYLYYDYLLRGKDPGSIVFASVPCTDVGVEYGGLGTNLFRITYEKMPLWESARFLLSLAPYLVFKNRKAMGTGKDEHPAENIRGQSSERLGRGLALTEKEMEAFLKSPDRARRVRGAERFRDYRIVLEVVESEACICGHSKGETFELDSLGRLLSGPNQKPVCILALARAWYRVLIILERMAQQADEKEPDFSGALLDLPISCVGGGLPLSPCGRILMTARAQKP